MSFCFGYLLGTVLFPEFIGAVGLFLSLIAVGVFRVASAGVLWGLVETTREIEQGVDSNL